MRRRAGIGLAALAFAAGLGTLSPPSFAAGDAAPTATARPRVALVLSGGGARGFAHVGVLKALERLRVPVDRVVGTSMGAAIGGAWASGASVEALEAFVLQTDWDAILADRPPRSTLSVRRRGDDVIVPSRLEFGFGRGGPTAPSSAIASQALESALRDALPSGAAEQTAAALPVPFAAVATDLVTGRAEVLTDTPLRVAIRASLAVPGLFAPYRYEERLLVDGGLVGNLPVATARALGADIVIAVNVGQGVSAEIEPADALAVTRQMLAILTEQNVSESLRDLGDRDLLIVPELGTLGTLEMRGGARAMGAGERAVLAIAGRLAPLSLDPEAYAARETLRRAVPWTETARPVSALRVVGVRVASPEVLRVESGLRIGEPATLDGIRDAADRLYGRGDFERVEVAVDERPDGRAVTLMPVESDWRASRLRLGLQFATDFRESSGATVAALHLLPWLNAWGGELRTVVQAGTVLAARTEWWQPLGPGSPWFASADASYRSSTSTVYLEGWRPFGLQRRSGPAAGATAGRLVGELGLVRVGLTRRTTTTGLVLPDSPDFPVARVPETALTGLLWLDTREPLAFPARGGLLRVELDRPLRRAGGPTPEGWTGVVAMQAASLGTWAGHVYAEWVSGPQAVGGLFRSSGMPQIRSTADTTILARAVLARQVASMPTGWGGAVRVGASAEVLHAPQWVALREHSGTAVGGSTFASVDTRLGPLYLGLGYTRGFPPAVHLILGPVW